MTIHKGRDLTAAIVAAIGGAGFATGEGDAPDGGGWQGAEGQSTFIPYVVVDPVTGGTFTGTIGAPFEDAHPDYIIKSIGATQAQCQFVNDAVFELLTTTTLTVAGRVVQLAIPDIEGGAVRDDDITPPVYFSPTRWRILTTSA